MTSEVKALLACERIARVAHQVQPGDRELKPEVMRVLVRASADIDVAIATPDAEWHAETNDVVGRWRAWLRENQLPTGQR